MGYEILMVSAVFAALLMLVHLAAPRLRNLSLIAHSGFTSFSGGFASAFVFLHMLPGLVENKEAIGAVLALRFSESHFVDTSVFLLALAGFIIFFGLRRWCRQDPGRRFHDSRRTFDVSIVSFSIYNAVIAFTLADRIAIDLFTAAVFTLAIALHLMIIDAEHEAHNGIRFNRWGRYVLSSALVVGWGLRLITGEHSAVTAALLSSMLAGALLLNVFHYELSEVSDARFGSFLLGIGVGTLILLAIFFLEASVHINGGT